VRYRDGWEIHSWHGTRVPAWVIIDPTIERIAAERNSEIRRCAIEHLGWPRFLDGLGVTPVDECPDPANSPHKLRLFDVPAKFADVYGNQPVRLLVMTNASVDRGTRERRIYAETVPAACSSALDEAAWQCQTTPDIYAQLQRAT